MLLLWIWLVGALIMAGGPAGLFSLITKQNVIIGRTAIQFIAVVFVLPLLLVLGVTNILGRETIGTVIGTVVGHVRSGSAKE